MQRAQEKAPRRGALGLDGERGAEGGTRLVWLAMISSEAAFARPSISIGRSKLEEFHGHRCKMGCHYCSVAAFVGLAHAQSLEPKNRHELKRTDLTGTKMEVVVSTAEFQPGEFIPLHIHHGEEGFYVIQGATVETPEGKQIRASDRGAGSINLRHVPHAGSKVVGDTAPKLATVHVVDKGTLLYDAPPNNSTSCVASEIQSPQQKRRTPTPEPAPPRLENTSTGAPVNSL